MAKYVVKNAIGHWLNERSPLGPMWTTCRADRCETVSLDVARSMARWSGGKVYRVRYPSAKRERRQAVGYLRALGGTRMYQAYKAALSAAAGGIERGEHLAWRAQKESK
jgi:hypothetical protein